MTTRLLHRQQALLRRPVLTALATLACTPAAQVQADAPPEPAAHATVLLVAEPLPAIPDLGSLQPLRPRPAWQGRAVALGDPMLARLRGGFQTPGGLQLSFGIERVVYINGNLVTSTRISVEGLGSPAGAPPPALGASGFALVQNGAGNTFLPGQFSPSNHGTVIQNSLNDQRIQTLTIINASANSLDVLRSWNLQLSIRDAVTDSVRR